MIWQYTLIWQKHFYFAVFRKLAPHDFLLISLFMSFAFGLFFPLVIILKAMCLLQPEKEWKNIFITDKIKNIWTKKGF